jgi:thioredoxin reductase (NADPH)
MSSGPARTERHGAEFLIDTIEGIEIAASTGSCGAGEPCARSSSPPAPRSAPWGCLARRNSSARRIALASCDGPLFAGREVCVVGGGDSALDEALVLAAHAGRVTVFHRGASLRAQQALLTRATAAGNIEFALATVVEEIIGADAVAAVRLRDLATGTVRVHATNGVFIHVGLEPNTAFLRNVLALDPAGHVETDILMRTSLAGVFAAGDIRRHLSPSSRRRRRRGNRSDLGRAVSTRPRALSISCPCLACGRAGLIIKVAFANDEGLQHEQDRDHAPRR